MSHFFDSKREHVSINLRNCNPKVIYEGYAPGGVAVFIKTLTDNKNRTASNIRTIFQKAGGSLGTQGSASHNFTQLGIIKVDKSEINEEEIFELAIEAGAQECKSEDLYHEIQCTVNDIYNVKKCVLHV